MFILFNCSFISFPRILTVNCPQQTILADLRH
nr:MAG TPA: hypothetical protein [Caudoviricetes sp.]